MNEPTQNELPKRNHEVVIRIGADGPDEVIRAIKQLETDFNMYGVRPFFTGDPDYGMRIEVEVNRDVTHDSFFEAIDRWKEQRKEAEG